MKLLDLLFIEDVKNPILDIGQVTYFDGNEWQVTRQNSNQLGWFWKKIGGRISPNEANKEYYFMLDHPIYDSARYLPKRSQEIQKEKFIRTDKNKEEIKIPDLKTPHEAYEFSLSLKMPYKPS